MNEQLSDERLKEIEEWSADYEIWAVPELLASHHILAKRCKELERQNKTLRRERDGEVWVWQGDEEDHPESLVCPVLMQPDHVIGLVGEVSRLTTELARLKEIEEQWNDAVKAGVILAEAGAKGDQ